MKSAFSPQSVPLLEDIGAINDHSAPFKRSRGGGQILPLQPQL